MSRPSRSVRRAAGCSLAIGLVLAAASAQAQITPLAVDEGATGLGLALRRLPVSGRVLFLTAHPDDENNGMLVMLGRGRGLETALQTLTRGDGGQNEIGPELFQAIGILRTEELLALHRYDGAQQYFSSAYEFGYSFSVEETFEKWGREPILRDVVRAIRLFRPDVILTLPLEAPGGGQHHQASAQLGREAFRTAADPTRFPEQIREGLPAWQARKIYQGGTGGGPMEGREPPRGPSVNISTADFDPLLGMSSFQFGMLSRAMHKCQGAGQLVPFPAEGKATYYLVDSEPAVTAPEKDLFDGVDTTLAGLARFVTGETPAFLDPGLRAIAAAAARAQAAYDPRAPEKALPALGAGLTATRGLVDQLQASGLAPAPRYELLHRLRVKEQDFVRALALAQGVQLRVTVDDGDAVRSQSVAALARVFNLSSVPLAVKDLSLRAPSGWTVTRSSGEPATLAGNQKLEMKFAVTLASDARYSQPYWRKNPAVDRWDYDTPQDQLAPWSAPDLVGRLDFEAAGVRASVELPAYYRYEGRWVGGEKQKVLNVVPALSVKLQPEIVVIPTGGGGPRQRREFRVTLLNNAKGAAEATLRLEAPPGWTVEPAESPAKLRYEGEELTARFFVTPKAGLAAGDYELRAVARTGGEEFRAGYQVIAYDHIQERHLFHEAAARVLGVDVKTDAGMYVGYVRGAGDEVPDAIQQLGFKLEFLGEDELAYGDLSKYTTIVTGIRAYQTRKDLRAYNHRLLKYAEDGGNLVVQYNKFEFNLLADTPEAGGFGFARQRDVDSPFAPYPAAVTANRVSVEEAPIDVLQPAHPLLTTPNAIGPADWQGWVQERGLYFLNAKDARYVELLASTDPWPNNPGQRKGMLTTAALGKGTWTYVGLGLWRQLPAGTTGAYRLLANILSRPRGR